VTFHVTFAAALSVSCTWNKRREASW